MEWAEKTGLLDLDLSPEDLEKHLAPKREDYLKEFQPVKKMDRAQLQKT
jgi:hypothetical protein